MRRLSGLSAAVGAAFMYFFDPQEGRRRRAMTKDRTAGLFRGAWRKTERAGGRVSAEAYGVTKKVTHRKEKEKDLDDVTLARKVESEIFRAADAPKGQVDVNAVDGVVFLRGEVEREELIDDLVKGARKVSGVKGVENLLHTPGTPAPAPDTSSTTTS
jgi:osmotically-inducible protein OsmY